MFKFGRFGGRLMLACAALTLAGSFSCVKDVMAEGISAVTFEATTPVRETPSMKKIVNTVSGVHVYWNSVAGSPKEYIVYRSLTSSGGYTKLASVKTTNYTDTTAVSGTKYYYKVRASWAEGMGGASDAISVTFVSTPDITTRVNSIDGIRLYWNKITGATGYAIYRKGDAENEAWVRVKTISGNSTLTWTDTSTKPASCNGTIYHYTVRALAGSDMKTLSGCRSTGRTMVRLNKPVIYSMDTTLSNSVIGTWSRNDKATGYEVRFMVGTEVYKTFVYGKNTIVKKTIEGLAEGNTYKIQVRSYFKTTSAGTYYSSWSDPMNVRLEKSSIELPFVPL